MPCAPANATTSQYQRLLIRLQSSTPHFSSMFRRSTRRRPVLQPYQFTKGMSPSSAERPHGKPHGRPLQHKDLDPKASAKGHEEQMPSARYATIEYRYRLGKGYRNLSRQQRSGTPSGNGFVPGRLLSLVC